jgi:hypothetical protein
MDTFKNVLLVKEKKDKKERKRFMSKKIISPTFVNCYEANNMTQQKFFLCKKLVPINNVKRKSVYF